MASLNFDYKTDRRTSCDSCAKKLPKRKIEPKYEWMQEPLKVRYSSPGVLIGNWFNRRSSYVPPLDEWKTTHDVTYTCKQNPDVEQDKLRTKEMRKMIEDGLGIEFWVKNKKDDFSKTFTATSGQQYSCKSLNP